MIILLSGSPSDKPRVDAIIAALDAFGVPHEAHIASAHKTPRALLDLLERCEADPRPKVYITIAGRSNALSGMVDAQVAAPVIACPPVGTAFGGADIFSSLRMPSGVAPLVVLDPANAALAAVKILALSHPALRERIAAFQQANRDRLPG